MIWRLFFYGFMSGNTVVKLRCSPLLDAFLGSRSSQHGSAAAAGCRRGVAAKGWGPTHSYLWAQELTREACIAWHIFSILWASLFLGVCKSSFWFHLSRAHLPFKKNPKSNRQKYNPLKLSIFRLFPQPTSPFEVGKSTFWVGFPTWLKVSQGCECKLCIFREAHRLERLSPLVRVFFSPLVFNPDYVKVYFWAFWKFFFFTGFITAFNPHKVHF